MVLWCVPVVPATCPGNMARPHLKEEGGEREGEGERKKKKTFHFNVTWVGVFASGNSEVQQLVS